MKMKIKALVALLLLACSSLQGQSVSHRINGIPVEPENFRIVIPKDPTIVERKASGELKFYLGLITGQEVPVTEDDQVSAAGAFMIGQARGADARAGMNGPGPDGFTLVTAGSSVYISGGSDKGLLYGVYELLEQHLGCRFWAPGEETVPKRHLDIPALKVQSEPAFAFREVAYAGMIDTAFADKMRCDRHALQDWGMWVHTMFSLVPPEKYFDTHPEYYALMDGARAKTQLCLTNPDVLKITIAELRRRMALQPDRKYWSVSQMDTYGYCECERCKGTPTGSPTETLIRFINDVAAAFPDKVISTLAYQYTRQAPVSLKPASNVNIMLCTIECDRSRPIRNDTTTGSFARDLQHWSSLSDDILVWDYVIQFTNMIAPFPNLKVLQPNIRLFRDHGVTGIFEQGAYGTYSENQELRQYMLAKLLWNPDLDVDSLIRVFTAGYYGPAAPYLQEYLTSMHQALEASGKTLWIYSSPMQETDAFLGPDQMAVYHRLFSQARNAASGDSTILSRVERAELPLRYASIEIAKKDITGSTGFMEESGGVWQVKPAMKEAVATFVDQCIRYGVKTIHERNLPPEEYGRRTLAFFDHAYTLHLAKGKPYTLSLPPSPAYAAEGTGSLTDGKRGSPNYYVLWQGFEGTDLTLVVDLGDMNAIEYAGIECLQNIQSWIFFPKKMTISISTDGRKFSEIKVFDQLPSAEPEAIRETGVSIPEMQVRYVKFDITAEKVCPGWHIGHGGKAWLFIDEIIVH